MSSNVSVINKIRGKKGKKDMKGKKENIEENKMGTMPVSKLVISMSFPMMISMTVQALYNVVDSIFVSRLSEHALTAVSMAFPIQNLMIAVVAGLAVGINSLLSRSLGEGNQEKVNSCADHGLFLVSIGYLIFLCTGLFLSMDLW
nr:MATE family efflux transporter [Anaerostipes sp. 494a]